LKRVFTGGGVVVVGVVVVVVVGGGVDVVVGGGVTEPTVNVLRDPGSTHPPLANKQGKYVYVPTGNVLPVLVNRVPAVVIVTFDCFVKSRFLPAESRTQTPYDDATVETLALTTVVAVTVVSLTVADNSTCVYVVAAEATPPTSSSAGMNSSARDLRIGAPRWW
jgi:hypothetical protein